MATGREFYNFAKINKVHIYLVSLKTKRVFVNAIQEIISLSRSKRKHKCGEEN